MKSQLGMTIKGAMALCPGPWQPGRKSMLSPSCIFGKRQRYSRILVVRFFAGNTTGDGTSDGGADSASGSDNKTKRTDIPLVFVHGMKGAHLVSTATGRRHWATLGALLNIPPRKDGDVNRDLSMPLTYTTSNDGVPKQDTGLLEPDGMVNHIVDFNTAWTAKSPVLQRLPFYGHVAELMEDLNEGYNSNSDKTKDNGGFDSIDTKETASSDDDSSDSFIERPTACFVYDWRRNLQELSDEFHEFCCKTFPDEEYPQVQIVAHSMGGLLALGAMRRYPDKYRPGAVVVGVPFSTGIQYLQDLQLGYVTELGRCRQFQPDSQFTMSSHWAFFPRTKSEHDTAPRWELEDPDAFVDVTDTSDVRFEANEPSIGKPVADGFKLEAIPGKPIAFDFYNVDDWEKHKIGIFNPSYQEKSSAELGIPGSLDTYKEHMNIQMKLAKKYRDEALRAQGDDEDIPPLVVCASNTEPTINQILRRRIKGKDENDDLYEYDYKNGRTVPGDGRIHFSGAFPPMKHDAVPLQSAHAKQFLWERDGGNLQTIMKLVDDQIVGHVQGDYCQNCSEHDSEPSSVL